MENRKLAPKTPAVPVTQPHPIPRAKRHQVKLACERCRSKKSRCDGIRPTCGGCVYAGAPCVYAERHESTKQQHAELQAAYSNLSDNFDRIVSGTEQDAMQLVKRIRATQTPQMGEASGTEAASHLDEHDQITAAQQSSPDGTTTSLGQEMEILPTSDGNVAASFLREALPVSRWTSVSDDEALLNARFTMFWTWDSVVSRTIDRDLFTQSLHGNQPGSQSSSPTDRAEFCSAFLVNAILALSTDCFAGRFSSSDQASVSGRAFAQEAYDLLGRQDQRSDVATIQGLATLAVYELSFGSIEQSQALFFDMLQGYRTFWVNFADYPTNLRQAAGYIADGLYELDIKMHLIFQRPGPGLPAWYSSSVPDAAVPVQVEESHMHWTPYPISSRSRPSYRHEAVVAEHGLSRLRDEHRGIEAQFTDSISSHASVRELYGRLMLWHLGVGESFAGLLHIPPWIFTIVSYHAFSIKMLHPFSGLNFLTFEASRTASSLCQSHSEHIIWVLWDYRLEFGMRHEYWMLYACHVAVQNLILHQPVPSSYIITLSRGCEILFLMGKYMPRANDLIASLQDAATVGNVAVPETCEKFLRAGSIRSRPTCVDHIRYFDATRTATGLTAGMHSIVFSDRIEAIE